MPAVANVTINIDGSNAKSVLAQLKAQVEALNGTFNETTKKTKTFSDSIKSAATSVVGQLTAVASAATLTTAAFNTLAAQSKAEAALKTLGVNADIATQEFGKLSVALSGQASTVELTAAAYDIASAGFANVADQSKILEAATYGAVGGLSDLNTVGNAVTSVLNAYGMSASQSGALVDKFIQTQNDGKIILAEYATQIGRLAPTAAAAGVGIDELNAAIATATAQGVPVEAVFTGLNQALVSILKPTAEAETLSKQLGIQFNEAGLKALGFGGLLEQIAQKTGGSTTQMVQLFGSVEALKAVLPLTNDELVKFNENLLKQGSSAGAAEKAFNDMRNSLGGALKELQTAFQNLVVAFKPVVPAIIAPLKILAGTLNLVSENIKTIIKIATFFATFVGVLNAVTLATKAWAAATTALSVAQKAAGAAAAFLQALTGPAGIAQVAAALGTATLATIALGAAMDGTGAKTENTKNKTTGVKDETVKVNAEINKQIAGLDGVNAKQTEVIATATNLANQYKIQTSNIQGQLDSLQRGASVTSARYDAELAINKLKETQLTREYALAESDSQRLNILTQIYKNAIDAAIIEYNQKLESIKLEQQKYALQIQLQEAKYKEIEAEGQLQILKAGSAAEEAKKKAQLDQALFSQTQAIAAAKSMLDSQKEISSYAETAAKAQLESKITSEQAAFEQKAISDKLVSSVESAVALSENIKAGSSFAAAMNQDTKGISEGANYAQEYYKIMATNAANAANAINAAANAQQRLNTAQKGGNPGKSANLSVPGFAKGGIVTGPTLAVVGEGGEAEYIIPQSKADGFAQNWMNGKRGASAVPAFADGGFVSSMPSINIQTGPVIEQNGQRYVSMADLERAMQTMASSILGNVRTNSGRRYVGLA